MTNAQFALATVLTMECVSPMVFATVLPDTPAPLAKFLSVIFMILVLVVLPTMAVAGAVNQTDVLRKRKLRHVVPFWDLNAIVPLLAKLEELARVVSVFACPEQEETIAQ